MIINSIELKGHGSYRDLNKVELPLGITGIVGEYDDNPLKSNGSGKSTLLMSILYALFGAGEYKVLKDLVNDSMSDDEMFARLNFHLGGYDYFLERGIKGGSSYLDFKGDNVRRGEEDKIKFIQPEILRVLGMDYGMFSSSGFFEQDALDKFINTDPETLRLYINKILGIEVWRSASKISNKKNTKTNEKISTLAEEIKKLENSIEEVEKELSRKAEVEAGITNISIKLEEKRDIMSNYNVLKSQIEIVKENNLAIQNLNESINSNRYNIVSEERVISEGLGKIASRLELLSKLEDVPESKISNVEDLIDMKARHVEQFRGLIDSVFVKLNEAKVNLKYENERKGRLNVGKCSECEQDVTQSYVDGRNKEFLEKIQDYSEQVACFTMEYEEATETFKEKSAEVSDLREELAILKNKQNEFRTDSKLLQEAVEHEKQIIALTEKNLEKLKISIDSEVAAKVELEEKNRMLQEEMPEDIDNKIETVKCDIKTFEHSLNSLNIELGKLDQLEKTAGNYKKLLIEKKKELKHLKKDTYIYSTLTKKYKDYARCKFEDSIASIQNVANGIIHQVLPEMTVRFYEDDSKLKKLVVGFTINGKERNYKRLSGGQKTVANIGIRLGFSKIIQARANSNIEFVVLDEPFGSLDENSRELVTRMLSVMLEWFKQIFVISHVQNVKEFPNVINVGFTPEGVSYIK